MIQWMVKQIGGLYTFIDFWFRSTHDYEDRVRYWLTDAKAEVNQYLTRSSWSWVDRNQKSINIIALLNYRGILPSERLKYP